MENNEKKESYTSSLKKEISDSGSQNGDRKDGANNGAEDRADSISINKPMRNSDGRISAGKTEKVERVENPIGNLNVKNGNEGINKVNVGGVVRQSFVNKKNSRLFVIVAVLAVFLTGLAFAAFYLFNNKEEGRNKEAVKINPQQIIKSSIETTSRARAYRFNGDVTFNVSSKQEGNLNFSVKMNGKTDRTNVNDAKSYNNMKVKVDFSGKEGSGKIFFDFDAMSFGQKESYYRLNDYDLGMIGVMYNLDMDPYRDKWYKMDVEEVTSSDYDVDVDEILKLYKKYEILKFEEDLGDTRVQNVDAKHYKLKLDSKDLTSFFVDLLKETNIDQKDESLMNSVIEIEDAMEKYAYIIDDVANNIVIEIWIGKEDMFVYRLKISGKFDDEFMKKIQDKMIANGDLPADIVANSANEEGEFLFNMDLNMSDFNKAVEINRPDKSEDLTKLIGESMSGFFNGSTAPFVKDFQSDSDNDGLTDDMEDFYGTDKNNPDTDGDGYTDGEEVKKGYDPAVPGDAKLDYSKLFERK